MGCNALLQGIFLTQERKPCISCIAGGFFTAEPAGKPQTPQKPPGSLSLVSECPPPHTLGCPVSKNQPHTQPGLCSTRPPSTGNSYWDQDQEAGCLCRSQEASCCLTGQLTRSSESPHHFPWTSDIMFCEREISSILRCHTIFESKGHIGK